MRSVRSSAPRCSSSPEDSSNGASHSREVDSVMLRGKTGRPSAGGGTDLLEGVDQPRRVTRQPHSRQICQRLPAVAGHPVRYPSEGRHVALQRVESKHRYGSRDRVATLQMRQLVCQHGLELDPVQQQHEATRDEHDAAVGRCGPPTWRSVLGRREPGSPHLAGRTRRTTPPRRRRGGQPRRRSECSVAAWR